MKSSWPKAIEFVLQHEGGYSNDPADPGGETHWGISKRAYPKLDIKNLTREQAISIYFNDYWIKSGADELFYPMDIIVFDCAVNMGLSRAKVLLQESYDWKDYLLNRIAHYKRIVKPETAKFFKGWVNRVLDLYILVK